nr:hypothetical protein [Oceanicoccus sp. KOV_DT_Chl]
MFSLHTDSSKVALAYLAQQLQQWDFALIDCQVSNPHLLSLGAVEIERAEFSRLLQANVDRVCAHQWAGEWQLPSAFYSKQPRPN